MVRDGRKHNSAEPGTPGRKSTSPGRDIAIRLRQAFALVGCASSGRAGFMNPGGPVTDRTGAATIDAAERCGVLRSGGTIVTVTPASARP